MVAPRARLSNLAEERRLLRAERLVHLDEVLLLVADEALAQGTAEEREDELRAEPVRRDLDVGLPVGPAFGRARDRGEALPRPHIGHPLRRDLVRPVREVDRDIVLEPLALVDEADLVAFKALDRARHRLAAVLL